MKYVSRDIDTGKINAVFGGEVPWAEAVEDDDHGLLEFMLSKETPKQVTMRQTRLALLQGGYLTTINSAIAAMPGAAGDAARIEWEFSSTVERNRPLVAAMASALNLSPEQIDDLFKLAITL